MRISPSIASCDQTRIADEIRDLGNRFSDLHIDIEDGNFTPNITFGLKTICSIRTITDLPFSIHLMVCDPQPYITALVDLNCAWIFVHGESSMYRKRYFHQIRNAGIKSGLALNPGSDVRDYEYLLDDLDGILYLTSEIDGAGEQFQSRVVSKMRSYTGKEIWVDGGINETTRTYLPEYVDTIVMGRSVFFKR